MVTRELTDHLEQPIVGLNAFGVHDFNEGLFDKSPDEVQQLLPVPRFVRRRLQPRTTSTAMKDRKKSERALLRRRQQVVAPLQCSAQGLMTWYRPAPAGQQRETILQSRANLFDAEEPGACGSELDCQWNAVKAPADVEDDGGRWPLVIEKPG